MKLFIHLKNTREDTKAIKESLENFDCSVVVENDQVVIITSSLVVGDIDLLNSNNIWEAGLRITEFIDIINGAAIVEGVILNHISLLKVVYENPEGKQLILGNVGRMEGILPGVRIDKPDISKIIPLALKDEAVAKALRLSSRELDWANLFRIYEVIKEDIGKFPKDIHSMLNIFTTSANKSSIVGDSARHGTIKDKGKQPKKIMSYPDAKFLIVKTLREWINNKLDKVQERGKKLD